MSGSHEDECACIVFAMIAVIVLFIVYVPKDNRSDSVKSRHKDCCAHCHDNEQPRPTRANHREERWK